jgi:hypothetical protein
MDSNTNSYTNTKLITVTEILAQQSQPDGWICPDCKHHEGEYGCKKNMFVSFVGCYTKDCQAFENK